MGLCFEGVIQCLTFVYSPPSILSPVIEAFHPLFLFCSSLNGLPEDFVTDATYCFIFYLQEDLETSDLYAYRKIMDNISSCLENFNVGKPALFSAFSC